MGRTIIVSRIALYRIVLGLCDYFHSENPVCSIIKPKASDRFFDCDSYRMHRFQTNITTDALKYLYTRLSFLVSSPSWLYLVNCAVQNVQQRTQHTKVKTPKSKRHNTKHNVTYRLPKSKIKIASPECAQTLKGHARFSVK